MVKLWPTAAAASVSSSYGRMTPGRASNAGSGRERLARSKHLDPAVAAGAAASSAVTSAVNTTLPARAADDASARSDSAPVHVVPSIWNDPCWRSVNRTS